MAKEYLTSYFSFLLSQVVGGRSYNNWQEKNTTLISTSLKNKNLAKELAKASEPNDFLTYAEYLTYNQFGKYGYTARHGENGMTGVGRRWPEALLALCKQSNLHHIVEFGPGNGVLGVKTLQIAQKQNFSLFWSGVEINPLLQKIIRHNFAKEKLSDKITQIVSNIHELKMTEPCLFIFAYSLDNVAPEVFINTETTKQSPDALVGIQISESMLSEKILTNALLQKKKMLIKKGIFSANSYDWDVTPWKLSPMQRAYIPTHALTTLAEVTTKLPSNSRILLIDEFRTEELYDNTFHIGLPQSLLTYTRDLSNLEKFYKNAGKELLYFPLFLTVITSMLQQLGFSYTQDYERHMIDNLLHRKKMVLPKKTYTYALLTSPKGKESTKTTFEVPFPY